MTLSGNEIRKQIHLAAHFSGVNNTTVWADPASESQDDFSLFVHLAETTGFRRREKCVAGA